MSQEKAQLIAPQGHFTVPGLNVAGVVTASSFSGNCTGTASSLTQGSNVVVGVMTASSFAGDVFGNAAGLSTTTAGLKLGIVTSTSFAGNFTGIGSGLTGTPNIVAGLVTASQFVGNTPGLAAGLSAGKNLSAGIVTATTFHGDGSGLTGAGSTAYIRQTVGSGAMDLNNGNIIYFNHANDTTVSFANTTTATDVTIIRSLDPPDISFSTGAVDFDGSGDYLSIPDSADFDLGNGNFTAEMWVKSDEDHNTNNNLLGQWASGDKSWSMFYAAAAQGHSKWGFKYTTDGSTEIRMSARTINDNQWHHIAVVRDATYIKLYTDGILDATHTHSGGTFYNSTTTCRIANDGYNSPHDCFISNVRLVKGTAVYTTGFYPPSADLTNITNTKLLCCQSDSSTTTAAVTPGTITASGDPAAGAQTVSLSVSLSSTLTWPDSITWNGGSAPTLASANSYSKTGQVFNLVTADGGSTWYGYEEVNNTNAQPYDWFTWGGGNDYGQLGLNQSDNVYRSSPVQLTGDWWRPISWANDLYVGGGLKNDGTLWLWGHNASGQVGQNNRTDYSSPVQVPGTNWSDAAGTNIHITVATKSDGTLWGFGRNIEGQLGQNSTTDRFSSPVQIPGTTWGTSLNQLGVTNYNVFAVKTDGTLWAWGSNTKGQLGQNQGPAQLGDHSSPIQIPGTTWSTVYAYDSAFQAIKTDGTMWTWGHNQQGMLGLNDKTNRSSPTQIPGTTWSSGSVNGGDNHMKAIKTDGTLWFWGWQTVGNFGNNQTSQPASSPIQIPGTNWETVGGDRKSLAVKTDGTLWAWGDNERGQLGQNTDIDYSSPVQIPGTTWKKVGGNFYGSVALKT